MPQCASSAPLQISVLGLQEAKKQKKKEANKAKIATRPVHEQPHYVAGENPCQWPQVPHYPRQIAALCTNFVLTAQCAAQLIQVVLVRLGIRQIMVLLQPSRHTPHFPGNAAAGLVAQPAATWPYNSVVLILPATPPRGRTPHTSDAPGEAHESY